MIIDIEKLYRDYSIEYNTTDPKHSQAGWIQIRCPFCTGNPGWHLGYNKKEGFWNCWRCGGKQNTLVVQTLLNLPRNEARKILLSYRLRYSHEEKGGKETFRPSSIQLPFSTDVMELRHRDYLMNKRNFNPESLEKEWGLLGTGPHGDYKFRVIAPIFYKGNLVSYQGRDITEKSDLKYKACREEEEIIPHKSLLYGIDNALKADGFNGKGIIVEGITDVWRIGPGAVATFGIKFTRNQVRLIRDYFPSRSILFDSSDSEAIKQANKLASELEAWPGETELIELDAKDPAELSPQDAQELRKLLLGY